MHTQRCTSMNYIILHNSFMAKTILITNNYIQKHMGVINTQRNLCVTILYIGRVFIEKEIVFTYTLYI